MRTKLALTLAAAAAAASFSVAPASASHTICDNEPGDRWYPTPNSTVGAGYDQDPGVTFVCVYTGTTGSGYILLVIRENGPETICTYYTHNGNSDDDTCRVVP